MGRIKDLSSSSPVSSDSFVFDGSGGTKRVTLEALEMKLNEDGIGGGSSEATILTQAEYNALTDDEKDSDTIYFISDAPFDSPNVVTLTKAQYDALSDAVKNDGRFYYVTDEAEVAKSLVVQTNQNSTTTVPSSALLYGLFKDYVKPLYISKQVSVSGDFNQQTVKEIGIDISNDVPSGYKAVGIIGVNFSITANGATGYSDWCAIYKNFLETSGVRIVFGISNKMTSNITNLSSINYFGTVLCVKNL